MERGETCNELEQLNRHSFAVAAAAECIAKTATSERFVASDAYASGMLHDVGSLARLGRFAPPAVPEGGISASGYLVALWGLPKSIVQAVSHFYAPGACPDKQFGATTAVHVAHAFLSDDDASPTGDGALDMDYLRRIGHSDRLPEWREICMACRAEEALVQ